MIAPPWFPMLSLSQALSPGLAAGAIRSGARLESGGLVDLILPSLVVYIAGLNPVSPFPDERAT